MTAAYARLGDCPAEVDEQVQTPATRWPLIVPSLGPTQFYKKGLF